jgi:D-inositol-3-phosphate glycosyltransferase
VRVVLVSANFRPHVGGIERFVENLAAGLGARGHGVEVVCCSYGGAQRSERLEGFEVQRIPSSYVLDRRMNVPFPLPEPVAMVKALRRAIGRADVVHVQDAIYATSSPALFLARRRGVASVLTQHVAFVPQSSRALDAVQHAANATLGRAARQATVVATLNPAVADWVHEQWGISARVLPVGIPAVEARTDRAELRRSFGLPEDRFLALFVGRDVPKKGLDVYLGAVDPAYELVAVTDRQGGKQVGARIVPFMEPGQLQELLDCVDAFVLPSEGEGFPVSLQEALAKGLPAVTTWQDGYEHYLQPDDVLVVARDAESVRDALRRLADDDALRSALAARSRAAAERNFGLDRFVSAYEEVYEEARVLRKGQPEGGRATR